MTKKIILSVAAIAVLSTSSFADNASDIKELKAQVSELQEYIEEVEGSLEKVETATLTDKIQFGLGMRVEANSMDTTFANDTSPANEGMIWRTKLNLNMKSKIADNLKFSGRLSMYKNWGDSTTNANYGSSYATIDSRQGRTPDNASTLYVERAYLDWITNPNSSYPLIVTMGRQPSSDGPSFQIKEDMARKGTYDALLFDGGVDGIVLTSNLSKATGGYTAIRAAYMMAGSNSQTSNQLKDATVAGLFVDKTLTSIKQQHLIQAYYTQGKNFNADTSGGSTTDVTVGGFDHIGAMFEIQKVSGFDLFAHYSKSVAKPNGNTFDGDGTTKTGMGMDTLGLLSSSATTEEKSGNAIWLGTRYTINKDWKVGAEYNKGSKNWFSYTYAPSDPMNKLATRGTATEFYVSKSINKYANIRFGHIAIDYDYTGSGEHLGTPTAIDNAQVIAGATTYGTVKEKSNTYITFNVLF